MARIQSWLQRVSFYLGIFLLGAVSSYIAYRLSIKYERTQEVVKVFSAIIDYKLYDSANITVGSILILLILFVYKF